MGVIVAMAGWTNMVVVARVDEVDDLECEDLRRFFIRKPFGVLHLQLAGFLFLLPSLPTFILMLSISSTYELSMFC